jgi:hypothetical protein
MTHEALDEDFFEFILDDDRPSRSYAPSLTSWDDTLSLTETASSQYESSAPWSHVLYEDCDTYDRLSPTNDTSYRDIFEHDADWESSLRAPSLAKTHKESPPKHAWLGYGSFLQEDTYSTIAGPLSPSITLSIGDTASTSLSSQSHSPWPISTDRSQLLSVPSSVAGSQSDNSDLASERDPEILQCSTCEATFKGRYRKGNLTRHRRHHHGSNETVFPCEMASCTRMFKRQDARLKHYRRHHPQSGQIPSTRRGSRTSISALDEWPSKSSSNRSDTPTHVTSISSRGGDRPTDWSDLMSSARTLSSAFLPRSVPSDIPDHGSNARVSDFETEQNEEGSEQLHFVCKVCGQKFSTSGQHNSHVNRSHNRRYQCEQCDKAFNLRADLTRHELSIHKTELNPFLRCSNKECTHTFTRRDNLVRHEQTCLKKKAALKETARA